MDKWSIIVKELLTVIHIPEPGKSEYGDFLAKRSLGGVIFVGCYLLFISLSFFGRGAETSCDTRKGHRQRSHFLTSHWSEAYTTSSRKKGR